MSVEAIADNAHMCRGAGQGQVSGGFMECTRAWHEIAAAVHKVPSPATRAQCAQHPPALSLLMGALASRSWQAVCATLTSCSTATTATGSVALSMACGVSMQTQTCLSAVSRAACVTIDDQAPQQPHLNTIMGSQHHPWNSHMAAFLTPNRRDSGHVQPA